MFKWGGRGQDDMEKRHLMLAMVSLYCSSPPPPLFLSGLFCFLFFSSFFFSRSIINICIVTIPITVFLLPFLTILLSSTSTLPPWDLLLYLGYLSGFVFFFFLFPLLSIYIFVYFVTRKLCCRYRILPSYNPPT